MYAQLENYIKTFLNFLPKQYINELSYEDSEYERTFPIENLRKLNILSTLLEEF